MHSIIPPAVLPEVRFDIACDVQNVLYGMQGAAYVYAPQKGASPEDVQLLDNGLRHFAGLLKKDIAGVPGTGAAGGIAAGLMGFFDVSLIRGIEMVIATSGIKNALPGTDLVITGEGKIDVQTLYGKVISEISAMAEGYGIPTIAFCGVSAVGDAELRRLRLRSVQVITPANTPIATARAHAGPWLEEKAAAYFGTFSP
jgi:glycerate kinase